jgi:hypothetical protein
MQSKGTSCRTGDEFADIDVARLFDGVSDGPSDGLGRDRDLAKVFHLAATRLIRDIVGQFRVGYARANHRGRGLVGFLLHPVRDGSNRELARAIDRRCRRNVRATDRGDINDLPKALGVMPSKTAAMPCKNAADICADHPIPFVNLGEASGESGITPALFTKTSTRPHFAFTKSANARVS